MSYKYKKVSIYTGSPGTAKNKITRDEHRIVMEKYLGRALEKDEVIHHCNDKPKDNRIENLELMLQTEHNRLHKEGVPQPGREWGKGKGSKRKGRTKGLIHGYNKYVNYKCRCDICVSKYKACRKLYRIRYKEVKNTCPLSYQS